MSKSQNVMKLLLTVFLIFLFNSTAIAATDNQPETALKIHALFDQAEAAVEAEDLDKLQTMIHPQSPVAEETRQRLAKVLEGRDLDGKVIGYHFLAEDTPYAFARAQIKWTGKGKKGFRNNITDTLYIFKQDGGQWKLWGELPLGVVLLD